MLRPILFFSLLWLYSQAFAIPISDSLTIQKAILEGERWENQAQYDSAEHYYKIAASKFQSPGDSSSYSLYLMSRLKLASLSITRTEFDSTLNDLQDIRNQVLTRFDSLHPTYFFSSYDIGRIYFNLSKYDTCISILNDLQSLVRRRQLPYNLGLGEIYHLISLSHENMYRMDSSLYYLRKVKTIRETYLNPPNNKIADLYNSLGKFYVSAGQFDSGLVYYTQAYDMFDQTSSSLPILENHDVSESEILTVKGEKLHPFIALCLQNRGNLYHHAQVFDSALFYYNKALIINRLISNQITPTLNLLYNNLGVLYTGMGDLKNGLIFLQKSLKVNEELLGRGHEQTIFNRVNIASVYLGQGAYYEAIKSLHTALDDLITLNSPRHPIIPGIHNNLGVIYFDLGEHSKAEYHYREALKLSSLAAGRKTEDLQRIYTNMSSIMILKNDYDQALFYLSLAEEMMLNLPKDQTELYTVYSSMGAIYMLQEKWQKSQQYLEESLALAKSIFPTPNSSHAIPLLSLGELFLKQKQYGKAETYIKAGQRVWESIYGEVHDKVAAAWNQLGEIYQKEKNFDKARQAYLKALEILYQTSQNQYYIVPNVYYSLATLEVEQENYKEAINWLRKCLSLTLNIDLNIDDHLSIPGTYSHSTQEIVTLQVLADYISILQRWQPDSETYHQSALDVCELAISLSRDLWKSYKLKSSKLNFAEQIFPIFEMGVKSATRLYQITGDRNYQYQAFSYAEAAKASLLQEPLRQDQAMSFANIPDSLLQYEKELKSLLNLYEKELFSSQTNQVDSNSLAVFRKNYPQKLQELDSLQEVFARDYPAYYKFKYAPDSRSAESLQRTLHKDQLVLEYLWGDSILYLFVLDRNNIEVKEILISSRLIEDLKAFRSLLSISQSALDEKELKKSLREIPPFAYSLYQHLLEQALLGKEDIKELIIIPDSWLAYIPFEALLTNLPEQVLAYQDLPYLIQDYTISYEFAGSFLLSKKQNSSAKNTYLGFAPSYDQPDFSSTILLNNRDSLQRNNNRFLTLQFNQPEVEQISQLFSGQNFLGRQATVQSFRENAPDFRVLHLAMHAFTVDEDPMSSGMVFSPFADSAGYSLLHAAEIYGMTLPAELAVLSACKTGTGQFKRGEGLMSLAHAFRYAGCRAIVPSLWQVEDQATQKIMDLFFRHLKKGKSKAEALRLAKLEFLQNASPIEAHPFLWSSFVLIGDPQPLSKPLPWTRILFFVILGLALALLTTKLYKYWKASRLNKALPEK